MSILLLIMIVLGSPSMRQTYVNKTTWACNGFRWRNFLNNLHSIPKMHLFRFFKLLQYSCYIFCANPFFFWHWVFSCIYHFLIRTTITTRFSSSFSIARFVIGHEYFFFLFCVIIHFIIFIHTITLFSFQKW